MIHARRFSLPYVLLGTVVPACASDSSFQKNLARYASETLVPGQGVGALLVGRTTLAEVKALFGETNASEDRGRSAAHHYVNGLTIVTAPPGESGLIQRINAKENVYGTAKFLGKTDKGIGLGDAREAVLAAYGAPVDLGALKSTIYYKIGVTFVMDRKDRVKEIVIQKPAR